jgi:filamentous hemagglutinin family protein
MAIRGKTPFLLLRMPILILLVTLALHGFTFAQVVTDGTLGGPKGPVDRGTIPGVGTTTYHITDSLGKQAGQNLFHSFSSFNVWAGESATFTGPGGIRNIVSRVTGGNYSTIDGTLRSTIQGANLYFLNPWGVVFGPNASLDVKGSFHVSTADYLRFEDGLKFNSAPSAADQVLSTASPAAFGFLTANPGPVYAVQSFLEVPTGETLSIVSGEIGLYGAYLWAPGGRINLASIASPGEVIPSPAGSPPDLEVQPQRATGSLTVHASTVDASDYFNATAAGTILIRAGRIILEADPDVGRGSWITADNYGDPLGGGVHILTGTLEISGGSSISSSSQGSGKAGPLIVEATDSISMRDTYTALSSASWASGDGGGMAITTPRLLIENEAAIYGDSFSDGRGGDMVINTGNLSLLSGGSISSSAYGGTGDGGNLSISATDSFSISGIGLNGLVSSLVNRTSGAGNAGRIEISTPVLDIGEHGIISAETLGTGRAADIDVTAGTITLSQGARISNSAFGTTGKGGDISITASDSVTISGSDSQGNSSGFYSYAAAAGDAGNISLSAPNLVLSNGALIAADTVGDGHAGRIELTVQRLTLSGGAQISSGSNLASGKGGSIHVKDAESISLSGPHTGIFTSTYGTGDGGDILISSSSLDLHDEAIIDVGTYGSGKGGNIVANLTSLNLSGGSAMSSSTIDGTGEGGQVTVQADNDISFTGAFSGVYSGSSGEGKGGNISLRAREIQLTDGARVSARSRGTGDAGNIEIAATVSFISRDSKVITTSDNADGGNIKITAPYMVYLKDSEITASVGGGASTVGGNISIDPQYVILDHSKIIANAYEGQGGNIQIFSNVFLADPSSVVDASSALGIDGIVDIRAPITEISSTLVPLGQDFVSALELLREPCIARIRGGKYSTFIVHGRDGLPVEPGSLLPSPMP